MGTGNLPQPLVEFQTWPEDFFLEVPLKAMHRGKNSSSQNLMAGNVFLKLQHMRKEGMRSCSVSKYQQGLSQKRELQQRPGRERG